MGICDLLTSQMQGMLKANATRDNTGERLIYDTTVKWHLQVIDDAQ